MQQVVRDEIMGELTRPSLEALTILAYRGPLTRPELEQIRGVHSSIILRNLMMRAWSKKKKTRVSASPPIRSRSILSAIWVWKSVSSLPEYEDLRGNQNVEDVLRDLEPEPLKKAEAAEKSGKRMEV